MINHWFRLSMVLCLLSFVLASCNTSTSKMADTDDDEDNIVLDSQTDSLSYAYGVSFTKGLEEYLKQMNADSTYVDVFCDGVEIAFNDSENKDKDKAKHTGYALGLQLEQIFQEQSKATSLKLSRKAFLEGFIDAASGKETRITKDNAIFIAEDSIDEANRSYAIGMLMTEGFDAYLTQMGIDKEKDELFKSIKESFKAIDKPEDYNYYLGMMIGNQLNTMYQNATASLSGSQEDIIITRELVLSGFIDAFKNESLLTPDNANKIIEDDSRLILQKKNASKIEENDKFMAEKAKETGVKQVIGSKVLYKVLTEGHGSVPTSEEATVVVHYEGYLPNGTKFDSSYDRNSPAEFKLNQVIRGWTEALLQMPIGSVWMVYIPQELAYGERGAGEAIPPYSPLIFKVELLNIK